MNNIKSLDDNVTDDKSNIITLNVGGIIMQTCKDTLINGSSYFNNILTLFKHNDTEPLFVDEDPIIFRHILNYLRDARYPMPFNLEYKLEWYGIKVKENYQEVLDDKIIKESNLTYKEFPDELKNVNVNNYHSGAIIDLVTNESKNNQLHSDWFHYQLRGSAETSATELIAIKLTKSKERTLIGTIIRFGDLVSNITLVMKVDKYYNIKSDFDVSIIKNIKYSGFHSRIESDIIINYDSKFIAIYDELFVSDDIKKKRTDLLAKGYLVYDLPTFWRDTKSFSLVSRTSSVIDVEIEFNQDFTYELAFLDTEYVYLDSHERKILAEHIPFIQSWDKIDKEFTLEENKKAKINFDHTCFKSKSQATAYIIVITDEYGNYVPINNIKITFNSYTREETTGMLMKYAMVRDNKIVTDKYLYYHKYKSRGTCGFYRIDDTGFEIDFNESVPEGKYMFNFYIECLK
jgi:hypothetical protein